VTATEATTAIPDVLRIAGDVIGEITTFDTALFPAFGLPPILPDERDG
jgi:hypothetical protein